MVMTKRNWQLRFLKGVRPQPGDGCWKYAGNIGLRGYGDFNHRPAHRVLYELLYGPIAEGLEIDHRCHNEDSDCVGGRGCPHRACVNPNHLEAVTHRENVLRGRGPSAQQARRTQCIHGHLLAEANVLMRLRKNGRYSRQCQTCGNARRRAARRAQR